MPSYNSIGGKWFPVKEKVQVKADLEKGENPIYEGPDRAAVAELNALGVEHLGIDAAQFNDTLEFALRFNCRSIEEYLEKYRGIKRDQYLKEQQKRSDATIIYDHDKRIKKVRGAKFKSGGYNTAGKQNKYSEGSFGDPEGISSSELTARA